jgi:hypothetical protein
MVLLLVAMYLSSRVCCCQTGPVPGPRPEPANVLTWFRGVTCGRLSRPGTRPLIAAAADGLTR